MKIQIIKKFWDVEIIGNRQKIFKIYLTKVPIFYLLVLKNLSQILFGQKSEKAAIVLSSTALH